MVYQCNTSRPLRFHHIPPAHLLQHQCHPSTLERGCPYVSHPPPTPALQNPSSVFVLARHDPMFYITVQQLHFLQPNASFAIQFCLLIEFSCMIAWISSGVFPARGSVQMNLIDCFLLTLGFFSHQDKLQFLFFFQAILMSLYVPQNSCSIIHFRNSIACSARMHLPLMQYQYLCRATRCSSLPLQLPDPDAAPQDAVSRRPSSTHPSNHYCPQSASSYTPASDRHPGQPTQPLSCSHTAGRPPFSPTFSSSPSSSPHSSSHPFPHFLLRLGSCCPHQTCTTTASPLASILDLHFFTTAATTQAKTRASTTP